MDAKPAVIKVTLPIQFADRQIETKLALQPCNEACLLWQVEEFVGGLPRPGASDYLLLTRTPTLIKPRLHQLHETATSLPFDFAAQAKAFDRLRVLRLAYVATPLRECACSYELLYYPDSLMVCPAGAQQREWIQPKYPSLTFQDAVAAEQYVAQAAATLQELNRYGIWHGDSGFTNCLFLPDRTVVWIDLNCTTYLGFCARAEYFQFVRYCLLPVLRDHGNGWQLFRAVWRCCESPPVVLFAALLKPIRRVLNLGHKLWRKQVAANKKGKS